MQTSGHLNSVILNCSFRNIICINAQPFGNAESPIFFILVYFVHSDYISFLWWQFLSHHIFSFSGYGGIHLVWVIRFLWRLFLFGEGGAATHSLIEGYLRLVQLHVEHIHVWFPSVCQDLVGRVSVFAHPFLEGRLGVCWVLVYCFQLVQACEAWWNSLFCRFWSHLLGFLLFNQFKWHRGRHYDLLLNHRVLKIDRRADLPSICEVSLLLH